MRKIISLILIVLVIGGLFYLVQNQASPVQAEVASGNQNQASELDVKSLQTKIGNGLQYSLDKNTKKATFIRNQSGNLPFNSSAVNKSDSTQIASQFIQEYGGYFGLTNPAEELSLTKINTDELGMTHVRYNQKHNGVPVFGGQIIVHLNQNLSVASVNGRAIPDISVDTQPEVSQDQAINKAKELWQEQFGLDSAQVSKSKLYILNKGALNNKLDNNSHLVWQIELYQELPTTHEFYYIDSHTKELVTQITGRREAVNRAMYDCSPGDGFCYVDTYDPIWDYTYGRSEGQPARGANPVIGGTDVDDMYDQFGSSHNYFADRFSLNGANNLGGTGNATANYPSDVTTSLALIEYGGSPFCPNAFFDGIRRFEFCEGLVVTDITGHEYTHAVNYYAVLDGGDPAGLTYSGESGALNESYSDIFGEAIEYYANGSNDWLLGAEVDVPGLSGPLRSMSDPSSLSSSYAPYPDRFYSDNFYCGAWDYGGVHHNSSVPNHAAYLMAMGGTFNGCTIDGIGRIKEEQIFYRALTQYLTINSDFNDAFNALITSCGDLYSASDCNEVEKALRAVEMNQGGYCSDQTRVDPGCGNLEVAPTITSVSSDKANGSYGVGEAIDIDVSFSEAVTSTGNVTVTLETGATDRTCTFTVSNATTASCDYTVQAGDTSNDLDVSSISGTIADQNGNPMTNFTPTTNLAANKNIIINTSGPLGTVMINNGDTYTNSTTVTLTLSASATNAQVSQMRFSNDNSSWSDWEAYATSKSWSIGSDPGTYTVYVQFRDSLGNGSGSYTDMITYENIGPTGSVYINAKDDYTNNVNTTLTISAFDLYSGVDQMRFSNNNSSWSDWEDYATSKSWTIGSAEGTQTVYTRFKDILGNVSDSYSDSIIYDSTVPTTSVSPSAGAVSLETEVTLETDEAATIYYTLDNTRPTDSSDVYFAPITISSNNTIKFFAVDLAGNEESIQTAVFTIRQALVITGAGPGGSPHIRAFDWQGNVQDQPDKLFAFAQSFKGGVNVASCDIDGDGTDEIIAGAGSGGGPQVRVFEKDGSLVTQFMAYSGNIRSGADVACGDLNGNGRSEIITGLPKGYGPQVRVFDGLDGSPVLTNGFFAYGKSTRFGVRVAAGDLDGDGTAEIITGAGNGAGTQVRTFTGQGQVTFTPGFFVYYQTDRSGINVATGDIDGNGKAEIICGSGYDKSPLVVIYDRYGNILDYFAPYGSSYRLGVSVSAGDVDGDGIDEIVTGTVQGGGPHVRVFEADGSLLDDFFAYDANFRGGVDIAVGDLND